MQKIIGREEEIRLLRDLLEVEKPNFVAIYGRRRVGKTYLVRQVLGDSVTFYFTGTANVSTGIQLVNFNHALTQCFPFTEGLPPAKDWFHAFQQLVKALEATPTKKKVLFIDELPWLDTPKSNFIPALEYFWNSWASAQENLLLVVCGSAASWMINNLINHKGGLHNRVTHRVLLSPFSLEECARFFQSRGASFDRYQLIQLYMVTGGIPFYLDQIDKGRSAMQNIDQLCFSKNGLLRIEFDNLFSSLFKKADRHISIIEELARKNKGMTREELIEKTKIPDGGSLSRLLQELEESGFIRRYKAFGNKTKESHYQVSDFYSLFYLKFIKPIDLSDDNSWLDQLDNPAVRAWSGYAFEQVCRAHLKQIKAALGIGSVLTSASVWRGSDGVSHAQVDLVIDRRDQAINLCEMKFSLDKFVVDKAYAEELRRKVGVFKAATGTRKSVFLTLITTFGVAKNEYADSLIQKSLTMDVLFER